MKHNALMLSYWRLSVMAVMVVVPGLLAPAYGQSSEQVLLLQQTPAEAGTVDPGIGVHRFEVNADVTLTANPKPGYQFVCWLGDVSNATSNATVVHLDGPMIVIAVFEQAQYEYLVPTEVIQSAPIGGLVPRRADYGRGGFGAPGGKRPHKFRAPSPPEPQEPTEFPVPDVPDSQDFPVPIPEPATVTLLALGALLARYRVKKQKDKTVN
jgi:hypothetical protein